MEIYNIAMTDQSPSRFGMPTGATWITGAACAAMGVERDRVSFKGHLGLAPTTAQGLPAWSPPS